MQDKDPKRLQAELAAAEAELNKLEEDRAILAVRIAALQLELASQSGTATHQEQTSTFTSAQKVELFMKLFRGRTEVYPKLWVNTKKGIKGYSPACSNEWDRKLCHKPKVKCGECSNQAFLPVTEKTVLDHFQGRHVIGVYPMLEDDNCYFLAVDFDKGEWQRDVSAFVETCKKRDIPYAVERSRSGNGAHVWFFFDTKVVARSARRMGSALLTETMARRHELPMSSYDRFFPNQDTMPRGGFGNLIALPFQDGPRQNGNSVFIDEAWEAFPDQWAFLASVRCMALSEVEAIAATDTPLCIGPPSANKSPAKIPVSELPEQVEAVFSELLFVKTAGLSAALISQIKRLAAFSNPEFYKKQALRLSTALTPRIINCAEDHPQHVGLPRGCATDLKVLLGGLGVGLILQDQRKEGAALAVNFHGELRPPQDGAAAAIEEHDIGVFVAPPGSGKTVVGAYLVAKRQRSTLVLVHRTQLMEQWVSQLSVFLGISPKEIGQIGAGKRKPNGSLDVAMLQSLTRKGEVDEIVSAYGQVIVDECHHVPAVSFERVMRKVKARYVLGMTATPKRRDGHDAILRMQLGPTRFTIYAKTQAAASPFTHKLIVRETDFRFSGDDSAPKLHAIYQQLAEDERRNQLILDDVITALEEGRSPILLTERRDHLQYFAHRLRGLARNLIVLQGGMKTKERRSAIAKLTSIPDSEERLVLAIGRFIGEGFDDARLDTLFLAMPVSWKGTLVQYAGRLHRKHHAKTEVRMMDYVDRAVPMLARMFKKRMRGYNAMGYSLGEHIAPEAPEEDQVIEYDQQVLLDLKRDEHS